MRKILAVGIFLILCSVTTSYAFVGLDTGVEDISVYNPQDFYERNMYGRFEVLAPLTITDVEGYFLRGGEGAYEPYSANDYTMKVSLYKGDAYVPEGFPSEGSRHPDQLIYSSSFLLPGNTVTSGYYGIQNASIEVEPGIYWAGFETDGNDQTRDVGAGRALYPLDEYQQLYANSPWGVNDGSPQFALRIQAEVDDFPEDGGAQRFFLARSAVAAPEPISSALFLAGSLPLALGLYRKTRAKHV